MADSAFTVYTLGDTTTFRYMLEGVALVFQDGLYSSNAAMGLGYGVYLGALILLAMTVYQAAFSKKIDITTLLVPIFSYILLTGPKVDLKVIDTFNVDNPQVVSNIPIGLALPLSVASGVAYVFANAFETTYSTPTSPRVLTSGFVSPLKTLNALRYVNISEENPYVSQLVVDTYNRCVVQNNGFDPQEYSSSPDAFEYFNNFLTTKSKGVVTLKTPNNGTEVVYCKDAGNKIKSAFEAYFQGNASAGVSLGSSLSNSLSGVLMSQDRSGTPLEHKDLSSIIEAFGEITDKSIDGRKFVLNTLFNQSLQSAANCASQNSLKSVKNDNKNGVENYEVVSQCVSWVNATEQQAEDNAAAATGMIKVLQDGQNILIIIAILLFPIVALLIVFQGKASAKVVVSYVIYLASIYMWLPMAVVINFYIHTKLSGVINSFTLVDSSDVEAIILVSDYGQFYEAIGNSLSLANGLLATLPVFSMMFFSGMTMGAIAIMSRWNVGGGKYYDASTNVAHPIAPSPIINTKSMLSSTGVQPVTYTSGGNAFDSSITQKLGASDNAVNSLKSEKAAMRSKLNSINAKIAEAENRIKSASSDLTNHTNTVGKNKRELVAGANNVGYQVVSGKSTADTVSGSNSKSESEQQVSTDAVGTINQITTGVGLALSLGLGLGRSGNDTQVKHTNPLDPSAAPLVIDRDIGSGLISTGGKGGEGSKLVNKLAGKALRRVALNIEDLGQLRFSDSFGNKKSDLTAHGLASYQKDISDSLVEKGIKLRENTREVNTVDGNMQSRDKSLSDEVSEQLSNNLSSLEELNFQKTKVQEVLASIDKKIEDEISFTFNTTLTHEDITARLTRIDGIGTALHEIARDAAEKQPEDWKAAQAYAENMADAVGYSGLKVGNPQLYENFIIFTASLYMGGEHLRKSWFELTGHEIKDFDFSDTNKAKEYNWAVLDEKFKTAEEAAAYVKSLGLDELEIRDISGDAFTHFNSLDVADGHLKVIGSERERMMTGTYNALLSAGFKPREARVLIGEVGRETGFQQKYLFGSHNDYLKKKLVNSGLISWNGDRKIALDTLMMQHGLVASGGIGNASYVRSQESLNIQAKFMFNEMSKGHKQYQKAFSILRDNSKSDDEKHKAVGSLYIVWAENEAKYGLLARQGKGNIKTFLGVFDKILENNNKISGGNLENSPRRTTSSFASIAAQNKIGGNVGYGAILGVVGASGAPLKKKMGVHLDIRYDRKFSKVHGEVSDEHLARIGVGTVNVGLHTQKSKITSGYNLKRKSDVGAKEHIGTDFALPEKTRLLNTSSVAIKDVSTFYQAGGEFAGGGHVTRIRYVDGVVLQLLHQDESMKKLVGTTNGKGGASGGTSLAEINKMADSLMKRPKNEIKTLIIAGFNQRLITPSDSEQDAEAVLRSKYLEEKDKKQKQFKKLADDMGVEIIETADGKVEYNITDVKKFAKTLDPSLGKPLDHMKTLWNVANVRGSPIDSVNDAYADSYANHHIAANPEKGGDWKTHHASNPTDKKSDEDKIKKILSDADKKSMTLDSSLGNAIQNETLRKELNDLQLKRFKENNDDADKIIAASLVETISKRDKELNEIRERHPDVYAAAESQLNQIRNRDIAELMVFASTVKNEYSNGNNMALFLNATGE